MELDEIPGRHGVTAELDLSAEPQLVRFCAFQIAADGLILRWSMPTAWMDLGDAPFQLRWADFDFAATDN